MKNVARKALAVCMLGAMASLAQAQLQPPPPGVRPSLPQGVTTPSGKVRVERCEVQLINDVDVPAQAEGLVVALDVDENSQTKKGDVIGYLDDRQANLTVQLKVAEAQAKKLEAENDANIRNAIQTEKVARNEAKQISQLAKENAATQLEAAKKVLEADRALLGIEVARVQQSQAQAEFEAKNFETKLAGLEVSKRQIIAPFDGIVIKRYAEEGEWLQAGAKVVRLVSLKKLRIEGTVKTTDWTATELAGSKATVTVDVSTKQKQTFVSTVKFVNPTIMWASQETIVHVEIDNIEIPGTSDYLIKPGMNASLEIEPNTAVKEPAR